MFDMPNGQVMVIFFFKLSGYHVVSEKSRLDHSEMVLGPFEILTNLVLDTLYLACNGEAFNIPNIEPPAQPVIPAGSTTTKCEELHAINAAACKAWNTYKMVLTITHDLFAAAIDNAYYAILNKPTDAGVPISDKTMITTDTKHALECGNMMLTWRKWKRCPFLDHTWPNWKAHWTAAFAKMCDINCMTAGDTVFGANQATKLKQAQQMASSLKNLANATIQKNTTIKNLAATKATLTKAIANIQLSIARMCAAGILTSPTATAPTPMMEAPVGPSHWSNTKPAWDKVRYCWTHGYKVKVGHISTTYTSRKTGHQPGATRANIIGGNTNNAGYPTTATSST
jgi:hypothetical protein